MCVAFFSYIEVLTALFGKNTGEEEEKEEEEEEITKESSNLDSTYIPLGR